MPSEPPTGLAPQGIDLSAVRCDRETLDEVLRDFEPGPTAPSEIMTVDEVAEYLRVDRKTVYSMLKREELPCARRIGTTYRIYRTALLDWLSGQAAVSTPRKVRAR